MCILCVASRWSRRIVTMLPWLIIPLIILWALSQLLPPGFRFEVTSPRLACVGVLLFSLGWYEIAMPRLSRWRARRSALQRERRRIEAQEAAKWRKEATRRCRNCLSAYREQTPGGGKFMCTFCGHVSRRPVLDVPGGPGGVVSGGSLAVPTSAGGGGSPGGGGGGGGGGAAGGIFGSRNARGWSGRGGWPDRGGWEPGNRGWTGNKGWVGGGGGGWTGTNSSWGATNWSGRSWTGAAYWGGGGSWVGNGYGGGLFGGENCVAGELHQGGLFYTLFKSVSLVFLGFRWVWRKLWRRDGPGEDGGLTGSRRGAQRKGDDSVAAQGSRGEKARRKAEEKKQARLEREQLEAEERRQREEVARLVEERRRLRDEKLEAEKESEREVAAERERELRREREAERRRQEKMKEKERELAKEKSRDTDSEDSKKRKDKKGCDKANEIDRKGEVDRKSNSGQNGEFKKITKGSRGPNVELIHKSSDMGAKVGIGTGGKYGSFRFGGGPGPSKGSSVNPLKNSVTQNTSSFWGRGFSTGLNSGSKVGKGALPGGSTSAAASSSSIGEELGKATESSYSAWNRMPWTKVWGKGTVPTMENNRVSQTAMSLGGWTEPVLSNDRNLFLNSSTGSGVADPSHSKQKLFKVCLEQARHVEICHIRKSVLTTI